MSNIEVVGLGALNIDHLYRVERILEDGEAVVNEAVSTPGGSAANTIYGLARLGLSAGFTGVIGDDAEGKIMLDDFEKAGADTGHITLKPGTKTGSVVCLSDSSGRRSLYVLSGANNLLTMDDIEPDYINQARILHISSFADDRQFKISVELMEELDSSTMLSFAPGALYAARGLKALAQILGRTHVLFINQDEMKRLTGQEVIDGAKSCLDNGCNVVVVTLGEGAKIRDTIATSYIRDTSNEYMVEAGSRSEISLSDTTGAGDAFAAGFLYGILRGAGLKECGLIGDIVARFSTTKGGARAGLPTPGELSRRYHELHGKEL
ncbi:carbohydrate kinase family protein [Chloroflexota bacterium]